MQRWNDYSRYKCQIIIKCKMTIMHDWLADTDLDVEMIMQVHDELIFEVAEKDLDAEKKKSSKSCKQQQNRRTTI
nr:DNA polymerase [Marinomonas profundimaris]